MAFGLFALSFGAFAASFNGTNVTDIEIDTVFSGSYDVDTVVATGGNYSKINLWQNLQSDNWHIYTGNVSSNLVLRSAGGLTIYDFGNQDISAGFVAFSDANNVDWTGVSACGLACAVSEDNTLSLTDIDNVTSTYSTTTWHPLIEMTDSGAGADIAADSSFAVNTSGTGGQQWYTTMVYDTGSVSNQIYIGNINNSKNNFLGNPVDYQVMIPTGDSASRTYYVYAELE